MTVIDELRAYLEAIVIGAYCRGGGHDLVEDEVEAARAAVAPLLPGPWRDLQTLAASIVGVAVMTTINELQGRGLAAVQPNVLAELLERLPLAILRDGEIEIDEEEGEE